MQSYDRTRCCLQTEQDNYSIRICPGFVVYDQDKNGNGSVSFLEVKDIHFRSGQFTIENDPNSDHRIKINVS